MKQSKTTVSLIDIYPTLIELCNLQANKKLEGVSLVSALQNPSSSIDRNVFIPHAERESYAVVNSNWRYIYYKDGAEELYNVRKDPNEWYNLAGKEKYLSIVEEMKKAAPKKAAPKEFGSVATPKNKLKLIVERDTFHWEPL